MNYCSGKGWPYFLVCFLVVWGTIILTGNYYSLFEKNGSMVVTILLALAAMINMLCILVLRRQNLRLSGQIRDMHKLEEELRYYSYYDAMAGTYNRNAFIRETRGQETKEAAFSVLLCDIDELKLINDHLGHAKGDQVIRMIAEVLNAACPEQGRVYRIGGDEFLLLLPPEMAEAEMQELVTHICRGQSAVDIQPQLPVSMSIGWAIAGNGETLEELMKIADERMYREKMLRRPEVRQRMAFRTQ